MEMSSIAAAPRKSNAPRRGGGRSEFSKAIFEVGISQSQGVFSRDLVVFCLVLVQADFMGAYALPGRGGGVLPMFWCFLLFVFFASWPCPWNDW